MNKKIDLVSQPKKSYWKLTIPLLSFEIFNAFYGLVDIYWASQLTSDAFYSISVHCLIFYGLRFIKTI